MRPSALTLASRSSITQIWPAGCTPRTMFRLTLGARKAAVAVPSSFTPAETGMTPIPPLNLMVVPSFCAAADATADMSKAPAIAARTLIRAQPRCVIFIMSSHRIRVGPLRYGAGWCSVGEPVVQPVVTNNYDSCNTLMADLLQPAGEILSILPNVTVSAQAGVRWRHAVAGMSHSSVRRRRFRAKSELPIWVVRVRRAGGGSMGAAKPYSHSMVPGGLLVTS